MLEKGLFTRNMAIFMLRIIRVLDILMKNYTRNHKQGNAHISASSLFLHEKSTREASIYNRLIIPAYISLNR